MPWLGTASEFVSFTSSEYRFYHITEIKKVKGKEGENRPLSSSRSSLVVVAKFVDFFVIRCFRCCHCAVSHWIRPEYALREHTDVVLHQLHFSEKRFLSEVKSKKNHMPKHCHNCDLLINHWKNKNLLRPPFFCRSRNWGENGLFSKGMNARNELRTSFP